MSAAARKELFEERREDQTIDRGIRREQHAQDRTSREDIAREGRESREGVARGRLDLAERREGRLTAQSQVRQDQQWQRLDMQKQDLERKIHEGGERTGLAQWRAIVDAQDKRAREVIAATSATNNMKPAERKKLLDEQDQFYREEIDRMKSLQKGGAAPLERGESRVISESGPVAVPEGARGDPDGTQYKKGGITYVKKGDQLVPQ